MTTGALIGYLLVPLFGVFLYIAPLVSRPTVQFGVRVPPAHISAAVIRRERRDFQWRSAIVAICATAAVIAVGGHQAWQSRLILIVEFVADLGCFWLAHRRITKVKAAENWFAGQRQTVVADTSWRAQPQPFPIEWLLPAVAVIVATVIIGIVRYPHLPAHLDRSGHRVATSPVSAFTVVVGQLYVTGLWTWVLALVYRSRPDLDTADPAGSLRSYRRALSAVARAMLIMLACVDLTLLLAALRLWQIWRVSGGAAALVALPAGLGLIAVLTTSVLAGRARARTAVTAGAVDRDDDRFWKGGFAYVNRDDPAVMVGSRAGFGWTPNLGNPATWLFIAGLVTVVAALVIIRFAVGL